MPSADLAASQPPLLPLPFSPPPPPSSSTPLRGDRSERREGEIEEVERGDCRRAEL
ncbi:hypothetical protein KUCAC02_000453, partial [Chaenocephalus aceratus]